MGINIKGLIDEIIALLKDEGVSDLPIAVQLNEDYILRTKDRLAGLANNAVNGSLTFKEVSSELANEGENLKVHLMSQAQIAEAKAEAVAGKVMTKLLDFIFKAALTFL